MGKRRTREHIIADLSVNYVQRFFLRSGHTAQRVEFDYGYDLYVQTFTEDGELESGCLFLQLKAGDTLRRVSGGSEFALTIERRDLDAWLGGVICVFLILYDAIEEKAYWLALYEPAVLKRVESTSGATVTLRIPAKNILDEKAVYLMRQAKNALIGIDKNEELR